MVRCSSLAPGLRIACYGTMSSTPGPLCRKFVPVEQGEVTSISKPAGFKFRLVSYNILAQAYVKSAYFPHSPAPCLKWKARSQAILTLLKGLEADFLCLQEVDEYDTFYKTNMENLGYASIYVQRSGRKRDGCGIFYKQNCAELVIEEKIDYNDLVPSVEDSETTSTDNEGNELVSENEKDSKMGSELKDSQEDRGDPNDPRVRLKRDCVGTMAAFRLKSPSPHHVIIANTHIYWDPEWADVKIAQAKYLLSRLAGFKKLISNKFDCSPSIIVAGDFNSVPGDLVYKYLVSGTNSTAPETEDELPIPLSSVYAFTRREPEFTNCTPGFTGTLDYIFFSPSGDIKPVSYLELPEAESSDVNGGLPNYFHPSDHLPIGAEFEVEA
ncbi:Glucose-repressible alcohol dehydrogenase transcriptional effector CCR4 [Handroanthus impetiginosus]|uniref:Glucose-repressible alcohol dehydrogenase transcriptional effector CCR4 n=1 Tax=Handroanthus impetiginosus TaxID=429701 RepID=A0A2G9H7V6_9LAMI|nr:Glucose-repressible alcohol dehydrogenase transcriptional effector CCR4 [Handroanthus impetiginosus]